MNVITLDRDEAADLEEVLEAFHTGQPLEVFSHGMDCWVPHTAERLVMHNRYRLRPKEEEVISMGRPDADAVLEDGTQIEFKTSPALYVSETPEPDPFPTPDQLWVSNNNDNTVLVIGPDGETKYNHSSDLRYQPDHDPYTQKFQVIDTQRNHIEPFAECRVRADRDQIMAALNAIECMRMPS
jgi:hypothetical protein